MLRYQDEINQVGNCPSDDFNAQDQGDSYHFVFKNSDEKNFLPAAVKKPKRIPAFKKNDALCKAYSLSMYESRNEAITAYNKLARKHSNIRKTVGDSVARGNLTQNDGISTDSNNVGHFSFFPNEELDLRDIFDICDVL